MFFSLYFAHDRHARHSHDYRRWFVRRLTVMAWKGQITPEYYTPVENAGLYWHFVDIVWIYLFPLLYLISRHQRYDMSEHEHLNRIFRAFLVGLLYLIAAAFLPRACVSWILVPWNPVVALAIAS